MRPVFAVLSAVLLLSSTVTASATSQNSGPAAFLFMWEVTLNEGEMQMLEEDREIEVGVQVDVDYHEYNADGTQGAYLGSESSSETTTVRFGDLQDVSVDYGQWAAGTAGAVVGQSVGEAVGSRVAAAAANSASGVSALNPAYQVGNATSAVAEFGNGLLGKLVGAVGGAV